MGNYKFRLSDMMPNSWFYKLKDISRASRNKSIQNSAKKGHTNQTTMTVPSSKMQQDYLPNRASYYLPSKERVEKLPHSPVNTKASDTHFPVDSPVKQKPKTRRIASPNPSGKLLSSALSTSCNCSGNSTPMHKLNDELSYQVTSSETDIFISVDGESSSSVFRRSEDLEAVSEFNLPPILTKPAKKEGKRAEQQHNSKVKTKYPRTDERRSIRRIKVQAGSPRLVRKKVQAYRNQKAVQVQHKKQFFDSFLVVKSSLDPRWDFKESMLEMIVENNIRATSDLEELLACYLSLNCKEYHEVIVKVFEEIWFELNDYRT